MHFRNSASKFRVNVDFIADKPAIAKAYASGQLRPGMLPQVKPAACREKGDKKPNPDPQPPPRLAGMLQSHQHRQFADCARRTAVLVRNRRFMDFTSSQRWIFVGFPRLVQFFSDHWDFLLAVETG
jgi:hypothetical protein